MKKLLIALASLSLLSGTAVFAQDDAQIEELKAQIEEKKAELIELEAQLRELTGGGDYTDPQTVDGVTITINEIFFTEERNSFEEVEPDHVMVIDYTLLNESGDDLIYMANNFNVYIDGKEADTYPVFVDMGTVNDGRSLDSTAAFAINGEGELEIEYEILLGTESALWQVDMSSIEYK